MPASLGEQAPNFANRQPAVMEANGHLPAATRFAVPLPPGQVSSGTASAISQEEELRVPRFEGECTLVVRNIPARYTQAQLVDMWPAAGQFNLLHLPHDHNRKCNAGKAFINFISHHAAIAFWQKWQGAQLVQKAKIKGLNIVQADIQGFDAYLQNLLVNGRIKKKINMPVIFDIDGTPGNFRKVMDAFLDGTWYEGQRTANAVSSLASSGHSTPTHTVPPNAAGPCGLGPNHFFYG